jgi:hypothetical protein
MDWLVASLLKLARIEADAVKFELEEYPMAATINKAVSGIAHKAEAKQQTIIISCAEDIRVKHDTNWMCEAFTNILNNDIEHTPVGGKIIISVENTNVYTRISIKDNGKGIPEDELKTIFDRFHRGSNNTNPNSVGIGLALTKAIITGQGGSIRADSSLGEYTEFIIFLQK